MNQQSLFTVAARLIGLFLVYSGVGPLLVFIYGLAYWLPNFGDPDSAVVERALYLRYGVNDALVPIIFGVILFFTAARLSRFLMKREGKEIVSRSKLADILPVGIKALGILLVAINLGDFAYFLHDAFRWAPSSVKAYQVQYHQQFIQSSYSLFMGIFMMLFGARIAAFASAEPANGENCRH